MPIKRIPVAASFDKRLFGGRPPGLMYAQGLHNYFGDGSDGALVVSSDTQLTSTQDGDMVVKNYTSLTINTDKTLTVSNRCKGLLIYVDGDCTINGTLTMTARGGNVDPVAAGVSVNGLRYPVLKTGQNDTLDATDLAGCGAAAVAAAAKQPGVNGNGKVFTLPRAGAAGASIGSGRINGVTGTAGSGGQTGGGGSGGSYDGTGGSGAAGTCFGGGGGGGGGLNGSGGNAVVNGGAGGAGYGPGGAAGGGAGNPGGAGVGGDPGEAGIGGLLILIVKGNLTVASGAVISSNGKNGGASCHASGGATGGGTILILYGGTLSNAGTIQSNGGIGGATTCSCSTGGNGGAGSIQGPTQILAA